MENTIIVNGKKISFNGNAVINIKRDLTSITDKKFDTDDKTRMFIEINGDIGDINLSEPSNILVNGNVNKIVLKEGNVECNDVKGKVVSTSLKCDNIKGNVLTHGDIFCSSFIGNTNIGKVKDCFIPITKMNDLKEGLSVYHNKYGKGLIKFIWDYTHNKSIRIDFEKETILKTLQFDKIIENKSLYFLSNKDIKKEYEKESGFN